MLQLDIFLLMLTIAVPLFALIVRMPRVFDDPPRHVLICSAHSDDCVIMGAEYAYGVIQQGLPVKIAYLTCSGPEPASEIARTRKAEALAAWSSWGVPEENLIFVDLSESPVRGPLTYSDEDIVRAKAILKAAVISLPQNAAVIVPAEGESHVDHRTIRQISLHVLVDSQRNDLVVYETPEYNSFLSLVHCPKRALRTVFSHLPPLNRILAPFAGPSNYVNGSPGLIFRDTPGRLAQKKKLLSYFSSQDGKLLVQTFGYETRYRECAIPEAFGERENRLCYPAFGGCCDLSVLAFALLLLATIFMTAYEVAKSLTAALSPALPMGRIMVLLGSIVAIVYIFRRIRRITNLETSLFVLAGAFGLIASAL